MLHKERRARRGKPSQHLEESPSVAGALLISIVEAHKAINHNQRTLSRKLQDWRGARVRGLRGVPHAPNPKVIMAGNTEQFQPLFENRVWVFTIKDKDWRAASRAADERHTMNHGSGQRQRQH